MSATVTVINETYQESDQSVATGRQILNELKNLFDMGRPGDFPIFMKLMTGVSAAELTDQVVNLLDLKTEVKQRLLETISVEKRLDETLDLLTHEIKAS